MGVVARDTWPFLADVVEVEVKVGVEVPVREKIGHRPQAGACTHTRVGQWTCRVEGLRT